MAPGTEIKTRPSPSLDFSRCGTQRLRTTLSHINSDSEERVMNIQWASQQAQQRIEQMRREASGDVLVRNARADGDGSDGTEATPGRGRIHGLATVLVRRGGRPTRVAVP
jgi:hypothetical protein